MDYPMIYSGSTKLAILNNILSSQVKRSINGEYYFNFSLFLQELKSNYITKDNQVRVDDQTFDIRYIESGHTLNSLYMKAIAEHVIYRLNEDEVDYYTKDGTPSVVLADILSGTDFTAGTVDFTDTMTFAVAESSTKLGLLYSLAAELGGEVSFSDDGFTVDILDTVGEDNGYELRIRKNLKGISKVVDDRKDPTETSYKVDILELKKSEEYKALGYEALESFDIGDTVRIIDETLSIDVENRIVSITYDPLKRINTSVEIANTIGLITDAVTQIQRDTVAKGKLYNGIRISAEDGFEAIRSDNYARGVFNSDTFALQVGDGSGNSWVNAVYFDTATKKYIFDGTLSATVIQALGSVLAPYLYAAKANIAELTVDQMNTGDKVVKYLNSNTDDVNYIKIDDQYMEWITASTDGSATEQVQDRDGNDIYWTDNSHEAVTTETTSYPVTIYVYTEAVKAAFNFELDDDGVTYVPKIVMGAGDGVTAKSGKGYMYKDIYGLNHEYFTNNTEEIRQIKLTDDGTILNPGINPLNTLVNDVVLDLSATVVGTIAFTNIQTTYQVIKLDLEAEALTDAKVTVLIKLDETTIYNKVSHLDADKDIVNLCIDTPVTLLGEHIVEITLSSDVSAVVAIGQYEASVQQFPLAYVEPEPAPSEVNRLYSGSRDGREKVYELDIDTLAQINNVTKGSDPFGVGGIKDRLYYNETGYIREIDIDTLANINSATISTSTPRGMGGTADTLYHAARGSDTIYEVDPDTLALSGATGGPGSAIYGVGGMKDRLYAVDVGTDRIYELDTSTLASINNASHSDGAGIGGTNERLYMSDFSDKVYELDPDTLAITTTVSIGGYRYEGIGGVK